MDISAQRETARQLIEGGDLSGARSLLEEALATNPEDSESWSLLGICAGKLGDLQACANALNRAVTLQPNDATRRYNYALALYKAGQLAEARIELSHSIHLKPGYAEAQQLVRLIDSSFDSSLGTGQPTSVAAGPACGASGPSIAPVQHMGALPLGNPGELAPGSYPAPQPASRGLAYTPATAVRPAQAHPGPGLRIVRGVAWGAAFGQWWTLWLFVILAIGAGRSGTAGVAIIAVLAAVVFGIAGSVIGFIIAAADAQPALALGIGVGVGLVLCAVETLVLRETYLIINIIFYVFSGRRIGLWIFRRVMQPVAQ